MDALQQPAAVPLTTSAHGHSRHPPECWSTPWTKMIPVGQQTPSIHATKSPLRRKESEAMRSRGGGRRGRRNQPHLIHRAHPIPAPHSQGMDAKVGAHSEPSHNFDEKRARRCDQGGGWRRGRRNQPHLIHRVHSIPTHRRNREQLTSWVLAEIR